MKGLSLFNQEDKKRSGGATGQSPPPKKSPKGDEDSLQSPRSITSPCQLSPITTNSSKLLKHSSISAPATSLRSSLRGVRGDEPPRPLGVFPGGTGPEQTRKPRSYLLRQSGPDTPGGNITFNRQDLAATSPGEPARRASQRACLPRPSPVS